MIFIFDSHPVQYKAPVYQRLQQIRPDSFQVFYASDSTMRGHRDRGFDTVISWDTPLLDGYRHTVLRNERGTPFQGFRSLTGRGVFALLRKERPAAVLISQFLYAFDLTTYLSSLFLHIPVWIRHETQDEAFSRPAWKTALRNIFYRFAYAEVNHAFYIGALNREHLLRHGIPERHMSRAPYCTPVQAGTDAGLQTKWRETVRERLNVGPGETLLLFSGKFIEKKNPGLILEALRCLSPEERANFHVVFVGAGPIEAALRARSNEFPGHVHFAGFINQSEISRYYAAADILSLPSRRAGETWGLVVNEALQSGCSVIMTRAVGCYREFGEWERVRVIPEEDAAACAGAMRDLRPFPRSFDWCAEKMKNYSIDAAAQAIAKRIDQMSACAS
jgi:glycosyltransferase involved in cell wall biosynthesis